jgi:hypothetical protein
MPIILNNLQQTEFPCLPFTTGICKARHLAWSQIVRHVPAPHANTVRKNVIKAFPGVPTAKGTR